ncbi:alpha/beta fold hydrolase [Flavobacterium adhaerens]|uniref:alpha/beta fold hydrolase n=1 Tax=Flavobacterium adhaerens TaxID=3149043 RepID=UPI0032B62410
MTKKTFLLILFISLGNYSIFGQNVKSVRIFKEDFDVQSYQNKKLFVTFIATNNQNDSIGNIIRAFFDSDKKKYLGYNTAKLTRINLKDNWIQYKGVFYIPKNAKILDLGILTSNFPKTINIAEISLTDIDGNKLNGGTELTNSKRKYEIYNYQKIEDSLILYQNKNTLRLDISNSILYGNNLEIGKVIKINNIDFYYEIYGTGEPLLLLHGNNESINSFRFQIDSLQSKYKVIAVDSRCQGRSSCNDIEMSYDQMADDMNVFINYLMLDKVNILGWSDGGNTGITMALKYPAKVKTLVTMGANLYPNTDAIEPEFWQKFKGDIRKGQLAKIFIPSLKTNIRVSKMCLKYPDIKPQSLNAIQIPVLVLAGEKDVIKKEHTELIANNLKKSELHFFSNSTHYAPQENPKEFNKIILNFLNKNQN